MSLGFKRLKAYNSALQHKLEDMDFMWEIFCVWNLLV